MTDLTSGSEARGILFFTLPMLLGNVFQQFYNMVDSIVVGNFLGKTALAAVGASFSVLFLMVALIMGVTMGTTVLVAQFFGARDSARIRATADTAFIFLFWAALAVTAVGYLTTGAILRMLAVPPEAMPQAVTYLHILFTGTIAAFGYNAVAAILRGLGDSRTPLYLLVFATLLNVVLDLLFVVVFSWGVAGAAWATVISQAASFAGAVLFLNRRNRFVRLSLSELRFDREIFGHSMRIGLPTGLQQTLVASGLMVLTRIVGGFGTDALAAYTAAGRLDSFAMMPAMNISQAMSTFTGQNIGAGRVERVRRGLRAGLIMSLVISGLTSLGVILFARPLMGLFNGDPEVVRIGEHYLLIVGIFYMVFSSMFVVNGVLRGAGEAMAPLLNTILALWVVRIPCALWFSSFAGTDGIWFSIPAGWVVGCAAAAIYYSGGRWKGRAVAVVRRPAAEEGGEA